MAYYWTAKKVYEYLYGSQLYGTATENSDCDYLVVVDGEPLIEEEKLGVIDFHYIGMDHFLKLLEANDIKALECILSPDRYKLHDISTEPSFIIDKVNLRHSISAVCSNSWVKGKKKILVENEKYLGLKSIFHCIRIMDFANQIVLSESIQYDSVNWVYNDLMKLDGEGQELWATVESQFLPLYKSLHGLFKKLTQKK